MARMATVGIALLGLVLCLFGVWVPGMILALGAVVAALWQQPPSIGRRSSKEIR
jgi:hypothetical protein